MDGLLIITGQRTGAGHLLSLLNNLPEAGVREDALPADSESLAAAIDRAELDALAHNRRVFVLRANSNMLRAPIEAQLLVRPSLRVMIVTRRMIDTYVSIAKAEATGAWRDADTTDTKVVLDIAAFRAWLDVETLWFAGWQEWMRRRGLPAPVLRYETHIAIPPEGVLRHFASATGQVGVDLAVPATLPHEGLVQQDRGKGVSFKITNWPEFSRALVETGLEKRAFGYPI